LPIYGKGDEHLDILSQIALIFSEEDEVARLKAAQTPEELYALLASVNG
jgi:PTS system mannitol-specific IIA component